MPNLQVPTRACKYKVETTPYVRKELEKRVRVTEHLPDTDKHKYRIDTINNFNNVVKRVKEGGQLTLSQLMPPQKPATKYNK